MIIENIRISEIIPYEKNPRINDGAVDKVAVSIREFGFKVPVVLSSDMVIIAGHTRIKAAEQLGMETVPCIIADDLTPEKIKAFRIADNRTAQEAEWDFDLLADEIRELEGLFDIDFLGFEPEEIDDILEITHDEVEEDDYVIDETTEPPIAQPGDIWLLGPHRVMCGDSTSEADVKKLVGDETIDLVVTDPPYNVDYGAKSEMGANKDGGYRDRTIQNDKMPKYQFIEFLEKAFKAMFSVLKPGGAYYIWHASSSVLEFETALRFSNSQSRQTLIWVKNALVLSRSDYHWRHEACLYGWKDGAAHFFTHHRTNDTVIEEDRPDLKSMKKQELLELLEKVFSSKEPTTIIREDRPMRNAEHPTMKPIKLMAHNIRNSSRRHENVLDIFAGSGSTLIAAEQLERRAFMMELEPKYVDVIVNRYIEFKGTTEGVKVQRAGKEYDLSEI